MRYVGASPAAKTLRAACRTPGYPDESRCAIGLATQTSAAVVPPAAGQLRRRRRSCRGTQGRSCAGFGDALHRPPGAPLACAARQAERR